MSDAVSLHDQATEAELHRLGLADLLGKAISGRVKRSAPEMERLRKRLDDATALSATVAHLAAREGVSA